MIATQPRKQTRQPQKANVTSIGPRRKLWETSPVWQKQRRTRYPASLKAWALRNPDEAAMVMERFAKGTK